MAKKQIAVIGLGKFGSNVVKSLSKENCDILAIDISEDKVKEISELINNVIVADATDEKILEKLNLKSMDNIIISIGNNLEASILITMILKNLGAQKLIVKANSTLHAKILLKVGADKTIFPEKDEAEKLAKSLISSNILETINFSENYSLVDIKIPKILYNKSILDSQIRNKHNLNIVAIKKKVPFLTENGETDFKEEINVLPSSNDVLEEGDSIVIIGDKNDIIKFKNL